MMLGSGLLVVEKLWPCVKAMAQSGCRFVWEETPHEYMACAIDGAIVYRARLYKDGFASSSSITTENNDAWLADFESAWKSRQPTATPHTSDGKAVVSLWPTEGSRKTFISVNWCDPCTWHHGAERVVDEEPSIVASVAQLAHINVIDTYHGRISGEDFLKDKQGNSFRVVVKKNGVALTEADWEAPTANDYTVNYELGQIIFTTAPLLSDQIRVTYHYSTTSEMVVAPTAGRTLKLDCVEAQFSGDIVLNDTVVFQAYGYAAVFAPQLGLPAGTRIPIGEPTLYKRMSDYYNEANGAYPVIPPLGGVGLRAMPQAVHVFPWDYEAVTNLHASYGMEIHVKLKRERPFGGLLATATFYCLSTEEAL